MTNIDKGRNKLAIFSFFSGVGFLDLGFEESGFKVKFVNELIPSFMKSYKHSREKMDIKPPEYGYYEGSVTDLINNSKSEYLESLVKKAKKNGDVIGFIAGPPCPDFSVGGKNRGKEGERGKLSAAYFNLIEKFKPDFFLFENVKGLWRTKKHRLFYEELKQQMIKADYVITDRLINAIEFGAPQDRDRIILIGFKKELLKNNVQYEEGVLDEFPWNKFIKYDKEKTFRLNWPKITEFKENSIIEKPDGIPAELTVEYWFKKNDVENHPNAKHAFTPRAGLVKFKVIGEGDDKKKSYKRLHRWRYSPTAAYGNNEVHLHPYKARRISAAEALAIQSLPKQFELPLEISLSDKFKIIGNGVPFMAANGIANTIKYYLDEFTKI